MAKNKGYTKLPGSHRGIGVVRGSQYRLYAGPDHLLAVESRGFSESYRRYYYSDIKAFTVRRTLRRSIEMSVAGLLMLGFFLLIMVGFYFGKAPVIYVFAVLAAIVAVGLLFQWFRGASCETFLYTAIQRERILSLKHMRTVRKFLRQVEPLIAATQGAITPEDLAGYEEMRLAFGASAGGSTADAETVVARPRMKKKRPAASLKAYRGGWHLFLFSVMALETVHDITRFLIQHIAMEIAAIMILLVLGTALIGALIKQRRRRLNLGMKVAVWGVLVYLLLNMTIGQVITYIDYFPRMHLDRGADPLAMFMAQVESSPLDSPLRTAWLSFLTLVAATMTILGAASWIGYRRAPAVPPPLPANTVVDITRGAP